MLIHQAAEQVRLLTGQEAPLAALIEGFDSAARER
jgi:shikimate 5-dehydrogenase